MQGWYIPSFETETKTGVVLKSYVESFYKANAAKLVRETYVHGTYLKNRKTPSFRTEI